jgi:hypothetical protein
MSKLKIFKNSRVEKMARRVMLNGYRQVAGKKLKKIKWVKSKKKCTLTRELKKKMVEGFHDGFIWGTKVKRKK